MRWIFLITVNKSVTCSHRHGNQSCSLAKIKMQHQNQIQLHELVVTGRTAPSELPACAPLLVHTSKEPVPLIKAFLLFSLSLNVRECTEKIHIIHKQEFWWWLAGPLGIPCVPNDLHMAPIAKKYWALPCPPTGSNTKRPDIDPIWLCFDVRSHIPDTCTPA